MPTEYPTRTRHGPGGSCTWALRDLHDPWLITTTLPADTDPEKLTVLSLVQAEAEMGEHMLGQRFLLCQYIVHPVVWYEDGKKKPWVARRIVFPRDDRLPIDFISEDVIFSVGEMAEILGRAPPWYPPVEAMIKRRAKRYGYKYSLMALGR